MNRFKNLITKFILSVKNHGVGHALSIAKNWITNPSARMETKLSPRLKMDNVDLLIKEIDFNRSYEFGQLESRVSSEYIQLAWMMSPFHIGSGGHQTIFRLIQYLDKRGIKSHIYITDGHDFASEEAAYDLIQKYFFKIPDLKVSFVTEAQLVSGESPVEDADIVLATRFTTAYYAALVENCMKRVYFIQDFEPMFFAKGYLSLLAENTYKLGMTGLCASPWLASEIEKYGMRTHGFYLGYDQELYSDVASDREPNSVAFYARYQSERRAVELGMHALEILQTRVPDLKVYLYGANDLLNGYKFNYENLGVLDMRDLPGVFNRVKAGLSFSLTNYSLTPTEMMACGLPLVELKGDNTEAVFSDNENILLAEPNPVAIADGLEKLLTDEGLHSKIALGGLEFVKDKKWDDIWRGVEVWLRDEVK